MPRLIALFLSAALLPLAAADFAVHRLYGYNMVLQCEKPIRISGTAKPGACVRVAFDGASAEAVADGSGSWRAELPAHEADSSPKELTVRCGEDEVRFGNILVGEVWLASGQSNMEMPLVSKQAFWGAKDGQSAVDSADYPQIRIWNSNPRRAMSPLEESSEPVGDGWKICTPAVAAENLTAVGFLFARKFHQERHVPVGLISASWGGTPIQSWISQTGFRDGGRTNEWNAIQDIRRKPSPERAKELAEIRDRLKRESAAWHERFFAAGKLPAARAAVWKYPDFYDEEWQSQPITGQPGYAFDGVFWYRKRIDLPKEWSGKELILSLGRIDDCDETYFNGVKIGETTLQTPFYWKVERKYAVPADLLRADEPNVIAIRVTDFTSIGGVMGPGNRLWIAPAGNEKARLSLDGEWKYNVEYRVDPKVVGEWPYAPAGYGIAKTSPQFPGTLYNAMIAPWTNFPIRGVLWYQGENDEVFADRYAGTFPLLIRDWRKKWNDTEMSFLFVQLAPLEHHRPSMPIRNFGLPALPPERCTLSELQEVQEKTRRAVPKTGMAVTIDIGDPFNVHPADKQTVADRLYGEALRVMGLSDKVSEGPFLDHIAVEGNAIRCFFQNVGGGLEARGGRLKCFEIAGEDGKFVWANACIDGESVVVSSPEVPEPAFVRYAWLPYPIGANLCNREGFPAGPFRSDR